jgi:hypothetical protein
MSPKLYPDDLAERFKARAGEKYRPSNGTEGEIFIEAWCGRCKHDAEFQANPDSADGCQIVAATFCFDVPDPKYPPEWQYDADGQPKCTAFEHLDAPDKQDPNAAVRDLFE